MAAGGFKEFIAGEILDEDEINDFLMQGVLVFAGTAARGSAITSPVEGQFSFLKDSDSVQFYDGSAWVPYAGAPPLFQYVLVGGGGGGAGAGDRNAAGAGAGGYRSNVSGENTGGGISAEPPLYLNSGTYTVTVGAGGSGATGVPNITTTGSNGTLSRFGSILSQGGGAGIGLSTVLSGVTPSGFGGSGGGTSGDPVAGPGSIYTIPAAIGVQGQGFDGGPGTFSSTDGDNQLGGGGGGAGAVGGTATSTQAGNGGNGVASSITGTSVTRAGGGGGAARIATDTEGTGGTGGGGAGVNGAAGTNGTANTGGGGGGGASNGSTVNGGNGGSGIVILKYPSSITLTIGVGLTSSTSTSGNFKITSFTAGTDTVSF